MTRRTLLMGWEMCLGGSDQEAGRTFERHERLNKRFCLALVLDYHEAHQGEEDCNDLQGADNARARERGRARERPEKRQDTEPSAMPVHKVCVRKLRQER